MSRCASPTAYGVGSQPPKGYVAWHAWAAIQHRGGLRQRECKCCKRWFFPQERHAPLAGAKPK